VRRLIGLAGVAFPHRRAMKLAASRDTPDGRPHGSADVGFFRSCGDVEHTSNWIVDHANETSPFRIPTTTNNRGAASLFDGPSGRRQPGNVPADPIESKPSPNWGQLNPELNGTARLTEKEISPERCREALVLTSAVTAREIEQDYRRFVRTAPTPVWGQFVRGLSVADDRKRSRLGRQLTADGVDAFCCWDRQENGKSKKSWQERVSIFVSSPQGAKYAIASRRSAAALRDVLTAAPDVHAFTINGQNFSFRLGNNEVRLPLRILLTLEAAETDLTFAADLVIRRWHDEGRQWYADIADDFKREIAELLNQQLPKLPF